MCPRSNVPTTHSGRDGHPKREDGRLTPTSSWRSSLRVHRTHSATGPGRAEPPTGPVGVTVGSNRNPLKGRRTSRQRRGSPPVQDGREVLFPLPLRNPTLPGWASLAGPTRSWSCLPTPRDTPRHRGTDGPAAQGVTGRKHTRAIVPSITLHFVLQRSVMSPRPSEKYRTRQWDRSAK